MRLTSESNSISTPRTQAWLVHVGPWAEPDIVIGEGTLLGERTRLDPHISCSHLANEANKVRPNLSCHTRASGVRSSATPGRGGNCFRGQG